MKRIKKHKDWGIFHNNDKEVKEYGFQITVLHPSNMEYSYMCSPAISDMEFDTLEKAMDWIDNYDN